jgi:succinate dehydrogenase / fumarate reductase, cytochrome b subunit
MPVPDAPRGTFAPRSTGRPTSPHLQIYRFTITMAISILHRLTGVALFFGTLLLAAWLVAAALDRGLFERLNDLLRWWPGQVVLWGFVWAYLHHLAGGVRHLILDTGRGFEIKTADRMAWSTLVFSIAGTVLVYILSGFI